MLYIRKLPRGYRESSWDDLRLAAEFLHHRLSHRKLLDLAGHSGREALHEPDVAGNLVVRDPILAKLADTLLIEGSAGLCNDPRTEFFAVFRVRNAEHLDILDLWMLIQIFFDFTRIDVLPAADDHVLDPSDDAAISIVVDRRQVARMHPPGRIDGVIRPRLIVPVAKHDR